jgi:hypothetical protein
MAINPMLTHHIAQSDGQRSGRSKAASASIEEINEPELPCA